MEPRVISAFMSSNKKPHIPSLSVPFWMACEDNNWNKKTSVIWPITGSYKNQHTYNTKMMNNNVTELVEWAIQFFINFFSSADHAWLSHCRTHHNHFIPIGCRTSRLSFFLYCTNTWVNKRGVRQEWRPTWATGHLFWEWEGCRFSK